jgi:DNA replication initiation complex subunit (GINS family)
MAARLPPFEIGYEALRRRQQAEQKFPKLQRLEPDFYRHLEDYLKGLAEDHQREHAANPHSPKATLLGDELQNTRRLAEDLYEHRERKVVTAALTAARGGSPDVGPMLREEQELFDALLQVLREAKRRALHRPAGPPRPLAAPSVAAAPVPSPAAPGPVAAPPEEHPAAAPPPADAGPADGRLVVRVVDDVGEFVASDLRAYTLLREQVVSLPADAARILIARGKAVEVQLPA